MIQRPSDLDFTQRIGAGIGVTSLVVAGMLSVIGQPGPVRIGVGMVIATLGASAGGALLAKDGPRWAGALGGLIGGPLGLILLLLYASQRATLWNFEMVLAQGIGLLPGLGIYFGIKRLRRRGPQFQAPT